MRPLARPARFPVLLLALALAVPALSGCSDLFGNLSRPDYEVQRTALDEGDDEWNTQNHFQVQVLEPGPIEVVITAKGLDGQPTRKVTGNTGDGLDPVEMVLPDGRWSVSYTVDGSKWETLSPVRVDATPPSVQGLERRGEAAGGAYTIGAGASVEAGAGVEVRDAFTLDLLASELPHRVTGLADGVHAYQVIVSDEAGNKFSATVQVLAGDASELPDGQFDAGIVARYTNELRIWDISDPSAYLSRSAAAAARPGYLGEGFGVTPDDPAVEQGVAEAVEPGMNTVEAALALYEWMFDEVEYDESRLEGAGLMTPSQVLLDTEDPQDLGDGDRDGLVDDGDGNGVKGGVCRDLAALYVSLLRSAGVPARLVTGYLAGTVNGFHAWVEFYGGSVGGQDPWIPVDVSPVDGAYDDDVTLQAFAIQLPEYLELRTLEPADEVKGWATALGINYEFEGKPPEVEFAKDLATVFHDDRYFCMNPGNLDRGLASPGGSCDPSRFTHRSRDRIVWSIERIIDYGVDVQEWNGGLHIAATALYPDPELDAPDAVEWLPYANGNARFGKDTAKGLYEFDISP